MRNTAFLLVGFVLLIVQSNVFRLLGVVEAGVAWLVGALAGGGSGGSGAASVVKVLGALLATPNLVLPLIVFAGVHEYSLLRGAALALLLGYALDLFAAAPVGLFSCVSVATFVMARVAGVRLAAQTTLTQLALAFLFALAHGTLVLTLLAIFGRNPEGSKAMTSLLLPGAVSTALWAPLVFRVADRVHRLTMSVPGPGEGAPR